MRSSTDPAPGTTETALLDKIEELSFLRELNDRLGSAPDFVDACTTLVRLVWEARPVAGVAYVSVDAEGGTARIEAAQPALGSGVPTELALEAVPLAALLGDAPPSDPAPRLPWLPTGADLVLVGMPTRLRGATTGVLLVALDPRSAVIEEERRLLAIAATSAALALDVAHREARAEFLAMLRHDINNPIAAALGGTEMIVDRLRTLDDPDLLAVAASVTASLETVADLVASCLDMAAVERGMPGLRVAPLDLNAVVTAVVERLRPVATERGQTLRGPARRAQVLGDRRQLARVVSNLVGNAIKYTPDGGAITVEVDGGSEGGVLAVRDTGYGIGPADLPRVFTKHARFHRDRRIPGSGLGLYLSRAIVEAHGGTITVASVLGEGSTFTVRLPAPPH